MTDKKQPQPGEYGLDAKEAAFQWMAGMAAYPGDCCVRVAIDSYLEDFHRERQQNDVIASIKLDCAESLIQAMRNHYGL